MIILILIYIVFFNNINVKIFILALIQVLKRLVLTAMLQGKSTFVGIVFLAKVSKIDMYYILLNKP